MGRGKGGAWEGRKEGYGEGGNRMGIVVCKTGVVA
jgi:hypothetical protein